VKICFDTNIILDVLLERQPRHTAALALLTKVETGQIEGFLCPTTVTTIANLIQKEKDTRTAKELIRHLLTLFDLTTINKHACESALSTGIADYEDAVLHESARFSGMDAIVTRNTKDFQYAALTVYSPDELAGIVW